MHIAFFNIPAIGHVYPTLAVAAALVARGHRVTYATVAERATMVAAAGATLVPYRSQRPSDTDPTVQVPDRTRYVAEVLLNFIDETAAILPQLEPAYADDPPDLIVHDRMSFAGRLLAAKWGVPTIQLWPILISNEHWSMARDLVPLDPTDPNFVAYLGKLDTLLARHGVSIAPADFLNSEPQRHIAFFPRAFQYHGERFDDRYCFVGPCPREFPTADGGWRPPDDGRPVLLITMGTIYNRLPEFYTACFAAFADSPWHVVMAVGERTDPASLGPAPANVEVHQVVPQLDVLAQATVLLCHGGMGSIMEALRDGVPIVAVPQTLEQEANAARVAELGLGGWLPAPEVTAAALRARVDWVAGDPTVAGHVARMRAEILTAGQATRAADVIEDCLSRVS